MATLDGGNPQLWNVATQQLESQRLATTWITLTVKNVGDQTIWQPTSGKRFRLLGYLIDLPGSITLSGGGAVVLTWKDASASMGISRSIYVPAGVATALSTTTVSQELRGNGILSAKVDNALVLNFSSGLTAGLATVNVWGTEE